ncbi:esterase/lipase family protein [Chamaesiphon minutus]|uniref:Alpha/beta hydrolase family protein n=1 Tax=Chamaesiphon minutus (strain ATCC 27169 / PCC 6605) TaxID=1173020 RepID=K9UGA4_CHAP6|nr:triacylglycerol lipase [Chamaesiphon minutus]AFY93825.1 alpha/beta hydrolase family protein [Chamaesiphon minutus PCC 6605]
MPVQPSNVSQIAPTSDRNPVFLVHGLMDTSVKMRKIASYLRGLGWEVFDIDLHTNDGSTRLEILAQQLADEIDRTFGPDRPIDLLGFSMGGLVSRYYLQRLDGLRRVQRFITISSPHNGTIAANFSRQSGCMQMRPNSTFMQDLSSDVDRLKELNFTSLWTPFDLIILPPSSSQLGIGTQRSISVLAHPLMVSDRRVLLAISEALSQPAKSPIRSNSVAPKIDSECV